MDTKEILKFCIGRGLLLDKDVLNLFSEVDDSSTVKLVLERIGQYTHEKVITRNLFNENRDKVKEILLTLPEENQKRAENLRIKLGLSIEISKEISIDNEVIKYEDIENPVKVIHSIPIVNKKITVSDFVKYFKNRFISMKNILQEHSELTNLVSINKISGNRQGISIIGIVSGKRTTKNKNLIFEIEDLTGKINVLINQNKEELYKKAQEISLDSVIGIKCSGSREILFANDIIFPDSFITVRKHSPVEEYALFSGDLHVGGKNFMEESFLKFIDYLNGKVPNTPEVEKIKYLFLVGDLIAGVGIFPGQEKELTYQDIEEQFERTAELLSKIKKDIKIIISPGNHDAIRIMEPQPLLDEKFAWPLYNMKNVILTQNPAMVNIGAKKNFSGMDVLTYHGYSFHYYANNIESLMREHAIHNPEKIMAYLLKNRHLAPTHSSTLYYPYEEDPLLIKKVPDIFVSGHTHKSGVSYYNNVLTVSSSTWESLTPFQEKMGNKPDFCKVPMLNLKTRAVKILDFE
jgi:DNA polymerase II small subunit